MLEILRHLNADKDRCVLIGRNALNFLLSEHLKTEQIFATMDYDIICPDLSIAKECQMMLEGMGYVKKGESATFEGKHGELDILISNPQYPQGILGNFYNPKSRPIIYLLPSN